MEREREYLHYIPVSLYALCVNVIEQVPSSDPVVMGTIKQRSLLHDISRDTHITYLDLVSL